MNESTPNIEDYTDKIRSGSEIVAEFIEALKADSNLDKPTIEAIEVLYKGGKLTSTNLLKSLEEARGKAKI
jgi:hypothetical protein